jgi:hypothetical protein
MTWAELSPFEKGALIGVGPFLLFCGFFAGLAWLMTSAFHGLEWAESLWEKARRKKDEGAA